MTMRFQQAKWVTLLSVVLNVILALLKILGGYFFNSHALIADGIHSISDLLTDAMVLFASKYGSLDADKNHPYGHQRIETAATLFLALLLILAGIGISWDAGNHLIKKMPVIPVQWPSLVIAVLSIITNEALFHYTRTIAKRIHSQLLLANAWHHRSDSASSVVVLLGLIGSLVGFAFLDTVAAIIVGFFVIKMGWDYGWHSVKELVDTGADPHLVNQISHIIEAIEGVEKIHQLRTRLMGGDVFIDVHVLVASKLSVSEGHYIAQKINRSLVSSITHVKDVTVHIDPEDDEHVQSNAGLPNRNVIEKILQSSLGNFYPYLLTFTMHYLNGMIQIDLTFSMKFNEWAKLEKCLQGVLHKHPFISKFHVLTARDSVF